MSETTLADLISDVADAFGKYKKGTVSSDSSTTTLIDSTNLIEPDDFWIGNYIYILSDAAGSSAAPEGEIRAVTDYDQGDHKCTVSPAFTASVSSDDTYEVLPLPRSKITRAVNRAIQHADAWFKQTTNTSAVTVADNDYDYSLPSGVVQLSQVWTRDDTDERWMEVSSHQWHVQGTPGSQTLYFDSLDGMDSGDTIRLEYMTHPSTMSADSDTLDLGEPAERECVDFVVNYALYWLFDTAAAKAGGGEMLRPYLTLAQDKKQQAAEIRARAGHARPAGRVHGVFPYRSLG